MRPLRAALASVASLAFAGPFLLGAALLQSSCDDHGTAARPAPRTRPTPKLSAPSTSAVKPPPPLPLPERAREPPSADALNVSEIRDESPAPAASGQPETKPSSLIIDEAQE